MLPKLLASAQILVLEVQVGGGLVDFATGGIELKLMDTGVAHEDWQIRKQRFCALGIYQGFASNESSGYCNRQSSIDRSSANGWALAQCASTLHRSLTSKRAGTMPSRGI